MTPNSINLNIFSNVASEFSSDCLAPETIRSFLSCFADGETQHELIMRIFVDPKPHPGHYSDWIGEIARKLPGLRYEVIQTSGLVDGFWRSVQLSESDYAVQLEHDWMFIKPRIKHSLSEIIEDMRMRKINYLRFNKRRNVQFGSDYFLRDDILGNVPMCRISGRSNNPQIIDIGYYRSLFESYGSIGLEGRICRYAGGGYLYGAAGWPRTVQHLDGRRVRLKDTIARFYYLTLARRSEAHQHPGRL